MKFFKRDEKTAVELYQEAYMTLVFGVILGLLCMAVGSGFYQIFLIQVGILLLVCSLPLSYGFFYLAERRD